MLGRIDWNPSARRIRVFSITLFIAFLLFSVLLVLLGKTKPAVISAVAGVMLSLLSWLFTSIGRVVYLSWMGVSYLLGLITSPIVAGLIFYLLVTPIGFIFRLAGKDNLLLKQPKDKPTYFTEHSDFSDPDHFPRQF